MVHRPSARWALVWLGLAPVLLVVGVAGLVGGLHGGFVDLTVYRFGGHEVLHGSSPLGTREPVTGLPFTYPPFAAVAMTPLAAVPAWMADALWTAASVAALAISVSVTRRALGRPAPGWVVALITVAAFAMEPVWQTLTFGQINLLLMAAVLVDVFAPSRRWSGVLLGVVAGLKLTPLAFVVLLFVVGRRRDAWRATITFAVTVVVGFAVMPSSAATYWTDRLFDAARVGPPELAHNQSVYGALTRLLDGPPATLLWLVVAGTISVATLVLAVAWWRRGDRPLAVCLAALATLFASPISWSHHWVWAVPVALTLWERKRWACALWTAVFVLRPMVWPPHADGREYGWSPGEHVVGNAYLLAALALALGLAVVLARTKPDGRGPAPSAPPAVQATTPLTRMKHP